MRLNGLKLVIDMAAREVRDPLVDRYAEALVLGSMREDVLYVPLAGGHIYEHQSWSHFYRPGLPGGFFPLLWPGPRLKANHFCRKAVARFRAGDEAGAFVQVGRALHLVTDMACPVHAQRTVHLQDRYEWYVEANRAKLAEMPLPPPPALPAHAKPAHVVESMARFAQDFRADGTNNGWGRLLKRAGWRQSLTGREASEQAAALIPACASHVAAMLRIFLTRARA